MSETFLQAQDRADRLRRVAQKLDDAVMELTAVEGVGFVIKLASDLRREAIDIEERLPHTSGE